MKRKSKTSLESSDEDDDVPLKFLSSTQCMSSKTEKSRLHLSNGYSNNLLKYRLEQCDFCDVKLFNRYQYFVHSATHIIIPLMKLTVQQCPECLHHFMGTEQLNFHLIEKHRKPLKNNCLILGTHENTKIIQSLVEKEPVVQLHAISNLNEKPIIINLDNDSDNDSDDDRKPQLTNGYHNLLQENDLEMIVKNVLKKSPCREIKKRFIFEEDLLVDTPKQKNTSEIISDLTNDCKVKLNVFDVPWWKNVVNPKSTIGVDAEENTVIDVTSVTSDEVYTESVHYDDLLKPGFYSCKRCRISFPNRYYLIIHEMSHLKIRKRCPKVCTLCEKIVGCRKKLKRHYKEMHPGQKPTKNFLKCIECGLQYSNYKKHIAIYHNVYKCHICEEDFLTKIEKNSHVSRHRGNGRIVCQYCEMEGSVQEINSHTRLIHSYVHCGHIYLCEVCLDFLKNRQPFRYNIIGPFNEVGVRRHCDKCGKKCFELMIVDKQRRVDDKKLENSFNRKVKVGRHKGLSNEDRLKHIWKRLKQLKQ